MLRSITAACVLTTVGVAAFGQASLQALGFDGFIEGMSSDGSVVVGHQFGSRPFIWTRGNGLEMISRPTGYLGAMFNGVSGDGGVISGLAVGGGAGVTQQAFSYTRAGGYAMLGDVNAPGESIASYAAGVSRDGSVVFGSGTSASTRYAIRWGGGGGPEIIGGTPEQPRAAEAAASSADGSRIAVSSSQQSFRWEQGGMAAVTPSSSRYSFVWAMSDDGRVICGGPSPWRWSEDDGFMEIPRIADGRRPQSVPAMSADGLILAGGTTDRSSEAREHAAYFWTAQTGSQYVHEVLLAHGVDLGGWTIKQVDKMSADGRTLVGRGINPQGQWETWYATIPQPLPAPGVVVVFGLAGVVAARRRR